MVSLRAWAPITAAFVTLTSAAAIIPRQQDCSQTPENFRIYSNTTGEYGQLDSPCGQYSCGVSFTVPSSNATSFYSLTDDGNLVVVSDCATCEKTSPAGDIAYVYTGFDPIYFPVTFATPAEFAKDDGKAKIKCAIAADLDGTCNLDCSFAVVGAGYSVSSSGKGNGYSWDLDNKFEPIQVKVDFSPATSS